MKNRIQQTIGVIKSLYVKTKQRLLFFVSGQFKKTEKTTKRKIIYKMSELLGLVNGKNYSKITPLISLNIMSIIVFGPCLTYLLNVNNDKWYIFLIVLLLPFIYTFYKYEYYSWKKPEYLDSESFRLMKTKYEIIASKTETGGISISTNLNFNDNDEL